MGHVYRDQAAVGRRAPGLTENSCVETALWFPSIAKCALTQRGQPPTSMLSLKTKRGKVLVKQDSALIPRGDFTHGRQQAHPREGELEEGWAGAAPPAESLQVQLLAPDSPHCTTHLLEGHQPLRSNLQVTRYSGESSRAEGSKWQCDPWGRSWGSWEQGSWRI